MREAVMGRELTLAPRRSATVESREHFRIATNMI
jgi:hypothetical protein